MAVKQLGDIFNPGSDVLGTKQDAKGTILAQTGDVVGEEVHSDEAEWWQHIGFASRPAKAIAGKSACQSITLNQGSNDIIIATRDLRGSAIYGTLGEGETCLYAAGPNNTGTSRLTLRNDGSATVAELEAALVKLGGGATEGVVCGGAAFTAWAAAVTAALQGLITAVATKPAVVGSPIEAGVTSLASGLDFPTAEISTVVKAAT